MGTLTSALATAVTDEYIHLQQPIHELYLRADAQCMHIFDLDAGDRIQFDLPEQQSIDLLTVSYTHLTLPTSRLV